MIKNTPVKVNMDMDTKNSFACKSRFLDVLAEINIDELVIQIFS